MDDFISDAVKRCIPAATYVMFMTIAFYATSEYRGNLPSLPVNLRYVMDVLVIFLAVLYFLVTADFRGMKFALRMSCIWLVPLAGIEVISMIIWLVDCPETGFIVRGSINVLCAALNVLCVASAYYMFGEKTVWYTLGAMALTVTLVTGDVMRRFGAGRVLTEYARLLCTFAGDTGKAMEQLEMHDLMQGLGVFSMYCLFCIKDYRRYAAGFAVSAFFFSVGLKRIDVIGILMACVAGAFYNRLPEKAKRAFPGVMTAFIFFFAYGYLILIKRGMYTPLMERLGINTMSRDHIYEFYKDFYELSPSFMGKGARYIYKVWSDYHSLGRGMVVEDMPHNEFMTYYIELGFWGFLFWLWSNTWYRMGFVRKRVGTESLSLLIMSIIYMFLTYATDNTFFYYSINIAVYVSVMAYVDRHRSAE